jgi:hypothetical protein
LIAVPSLWKLTSRPSSRSGLVTWPASAMMRSSLKSIAALREREFFFLLPSHDVPVADDYRDRMTAPKEIK